MPLERDGDYTESGLRLLELRADVVLEAERIRAAISVLSLSVSADLKGTAEAYLRYQLSSPSNPFTQKEN